MSEDIAILIQARLGSTRLPKKLAQPIGNDATTLERVYRRSTATGLPTYAIVPPLDAATIRSMQVETSGRMISPLRELYTRILAPAVAESNVLGRYRVAAESLDLKTVVRITADCPLVDPNLIIRLLEEYSRRRVLIAGLSIGKYATGNRFPDGVDVEIISIDLLRLIDRVLSPSAAEREHVTEWFWKSVKFGIWTDAYYRLSPNTEDYSAVKWSIDTKEDLAHVRQLVKRVRDGSWQDYIRIERELEKEKR